MTSTISRRRHFQLVPNEIDNPYSTPVYRPNQPDNPYSIPFLRPASRRTASFGSSTSFSSNSSPRSLSFGDVSFGSPLFSPGTPLKSSGIPFSWEQIPGIPKNQIITGKKDSSHDHLPLPPASNSFRKTSKEDISLEMDPFFTAMVECSKDDHDGQLGKILKISKIPKILSDPMAIISMYGSCSRSCSVSESFVYNPRSRPSSLVNRRRST